jgi:predicted PurR-regulated permease PerM
MDDKKVPLFLLGILALVAAGVVLKYLQPVILPLVIAWFLSYIMNPTVEFMARKKVPRGLAIFIVLLIFFGICYLGAIFIFGRVSAFTEAFPKYQARFTEITGALHSKLDLKTNPLAQINWEKTVGRFLLTLSGSLVSVISNLVMVIIFLIFLLGGKPYFKFKIKKAFKQEQGDRFAQVLSSASSQITRYLAIQFLLSSATGVLIWVALAVIGVDFAATWGVLAFFLNFIPTVGSILASIPPIILALVQFYPGILPGIITLIVILGIQLLIGGGIGPKVMGDKLNLSSVVVLLSLAFWGWLWGIVGAILSIPIASAIKIVCENVDELRPVSVMMGSGKTLRHEFEE